MSFQEAMEVMSRDDRFKATVYARNTLLIHKGVYTQEEEFETLFVESAEKQTKTKVNARQANAFGG
jgi:hypothetical protein